MNNLLLKIILAACALTCSTLFSQSSEEAPTWNIFQTVVQVRNDSYISENKIQPWMKKNLSTGLGSGVVIGKNLILTNAHVVMDASRITVRLNGSQLDYAARVLFLGFDCDLALLEVTDNEFSEKTNVISLADSMPVLGSELLVLGFPNGQDNLTVEKGSILRYEKSRYSFSGLDFRNVIKINANIQPGNSGGPAIQNGKVIGVTFQISKTGKDVAYLIPVDIVRHFLKDIRDGKYEGFPNLGFTFQSGAPVSLKLGMRIPGEEKGVFINRIYPNSSFSKILKEKDFLVSIDNLPISVEGEVSIGKQKESIVDYIENKQMGETIAIEVYRSGKKYQGETNLQKNFALDLYRETADDYLLAAGFVFQPISRSFFNSDDGDLDSSIKYHYSYFIQDLLYRYTNRDVVLSFIFDDPEILKYKKYKYKVVESINGMVPKDLEDLKRIWQSHEKDFVILRFRGMELPIVLASESINQINVRVKKRYGANNEK
ncbi:serine protease [Leptospira ognonensis]|uniref:Serine protease n=1 Tax=Leptospira ognonensis TaxID=2484945 RepID=A0A4R9K437_9LEPT|nr:S1C family serine protease [Leptospira ognonensis]TGL60261.1 serine protease [Leptospira ognonensis]